MSRFLPLAVLVTTISVLIVLWSTNSFDPTHSNLKAATQEVVAQQSQVEQSAVPDVQGVPEEKKQFPKAVAVETSYDFGVLPRFTKRERYFEILNEGTAPLILKNGPSSCSCTILDLEDSEIAPGESGKIKLEWDLKFKEGPFAQSAVILTNDPNNPEIEFSVHGFIETRFGFSLPVLTFSALKSGESATQETLIYSRTFTSLGTISEQTKLEIPGLVIEQMPASEDELKERDALSGIKLKVTVPADLPSGHHIGQVVFTAHPPAAEANQLDEQASHDAGTTATPMAALIVNAHVKSHGVKFFSPLIDGYGRIRLGEISSKTGSEVFKLNFHVDQGDTPWKLTRARTYPKYLDVKVVPVDENIGLYQLQIQIPPGVPQGNFYGQEIARIVLESDHPLIPKIPITNDIGIMLEYHVK